MTQTVSTDNWIFGKTRSGQPVQAFKLRNGSMELVLITRGAGIQSLRVPDRSGKVDNVAISFPSLADYEANHTWYFGSTVGRYANRIANGLLTIDGTTYHLPKNDKGKSCLHGGIDSFDSQVWHAEVASEGDPSVLFSYTSPDGDNGFPGNLSMQVKYTLTPDSVAIEYRATTDKTTVCNPTNHAYWNLGGSSLPSILDQVLRLNASTYTPVDEDKIPTGEIRAVAGTPFDFTHDRTIGSQIQTLGEYDHNFIIDGTNCDTTFAARAADPVSGRTMTVYTTAPALQLFTTSWNADSLKGSINIEPGYRAYCLETQFAPNSPNIPTFPSTTLRPNEQFYSQTIYKFGIE